MKKTRPYLMHLLRQYRAFVLLYALALFAAHPLLVYFNKRQEAAYLDMYTSVQYMPQMTLAPLSLVVIALGIVTPFIVFGFVYNKATMDTYFSMPIKRVNLFLKHFFFGWLMIVIPMLLSLLLGFILYQVMSVPALLAVHPYTFLTLVTQAGLLLAGSLMTMMPSMLAILCTTNLFNGIIYAGVLNIFPYLIKAVWNLFATNFIGYTALSWNDSTAELAWLEFHKLYFSAFGGINSVENKVDILLWFVFALALLFLSAKLFATHRVERTNSAYMIKGFYPVIITGFGFLALVGALAVNHETSRYHSGIFTDQTFIFVFVIGFITYFVIQIIRRLGMPKILPTILCYVAIFTCASLTSWFLSGWVRDNRGRVLLSADQVAKVRLLSATMDYGLEREEPQEGIFYEPFGRTSEWIENTYEDPALIEKTLQLQENLISYWSIKEKTHGGLETRNIWAPSLRIYYLDESGEILQVRQYPIVSDAEMELATELLGQKPLEPDEYREEYEKLVNEDPDFVG